MPVSFFIVGLLTVLAAIATVSLRNLVHSALSLAVTFAGLAALFLQLDAEFVGLVQILVYVGAVAILIVFAILLTRGADAPRLPRPAGPLGAGIVIGAGACLTMMWAVISSAGLPAVQRSPVEVTVKAVGERLMAEYVVPLEVLGLLLTAAMIGGVIVAMSEKKPDR